MSDIKLFQLGQSVTPIELKPVTLEKRSSDAYRTEYEDFFRRTLS